MKRLSAVLFLALSGLSIQSALADDASHRALASQLVDLTDGKAPMRASFDAVMDGIIQNMAQHGMPQEGVDEIKAAIDKWYAQQINFSDIQPKIVDAYEKEFSEDDLKQILAFYNSPIGQKTIKTMPLAMQQAAQIEQNTPRTKSRRSMRTSPQSS